MKNTKIIKLCKPKSLSKINCQGFILKNNDELLYWFYLFRHCEGATTEAICSLVRATFVFKPKRLPQKQKMLLLNDAK